MDRFLELHRRGQMAVAAMQYHWTPMLSTAGMLRSLLPVMRLRRDYGLHITTAMQCDVNGAAWRWADLLPAVGVDSLTMSINMHRAAGPSRISPPSGGADPAAGGCWPTTGRITSTASSATASGTKQQRKRCCPAPSPRWKPGRTTPTTSSMRR